MLFTVDARQAKAMQIIVKSEMSGVIALPGFIRLDVNCRTGSSWAEAQSDADVISLGDSTQFKRVLEEQCKGKGEDGFYRSKECALQICFESLPVAGDCGLRAMRRFSWFLF